MPKISKIKDNIVTLSGEAKYKENQYYKLSENTEGFILSATEKEAKLLVTGDPSEIKVNTIATLVDKNSEVEVYDYHFGKIINPFGGVIHPTNFEVPENPVKIGEGNTENSSPEILDRLPLTDPLDTGVLVIDTMIPIGKGQRELIIGDRNTGKTSIALSAIINQRNKETKVVYIAIGQKRNSIISTYNTLKEFDALKNTIIVFANPDSSAQQFLVPKIGMAMAEAIAYQGNDVLVVIDDLTKHANVYREVSLSIGRNPGREAYPTDIFYQHSSLLERAGKFGKKYNGGSITALPIVETIQGDVASLIPSNVISITDGQIFTSAEKFNNGIYPAINIQLSVSRTGSAVQSKTVKHSSKNLKADHARLAEIKKFLDMSVNVSEELDKKIERFNGLNNVLMQYGYEGYSREAITILVQLYREGAMGRIEDPKIFSKIFHYVMNNDKASIALASRMKEGTVEEEEFKRAIDNYYIPLSKAASGISGQIFSLEELTKIKEGK